MKLFIAALFLILGSTQAHAGIILCEYQATACNDQGNHYMCEVYGWAAGEYCSSRDESTRHRNSLSQRYTCEMVPQTCGFSRELCCDEKHQCKCGPLLTDQ